MKRWTTQKVIEYEYGPYVAYSDYLKEIKVLKEALREALDGWEYDAPQYTQWDGTKIRYRRISELRKLLSDPTS